MRIKILHVITARDWGGATRVCFDIVSNLDKNIFDVEIISAPGILANKLESIGLKVFTIDNIRRNISPVNDFFALIKIFKIIRKNKYNIVHCHTSKAGLLGRIAAKLAGVKLIYFTAHGWCFYNKEEYGLIEILLVWLERFCGKFTTKIICVSKSVKEDGLKKRIASPEKFEIIYNGVKEEKNYYQKEETKKKLKLGKEIVVSMVGRLAYPKKPIEFLMIGEKLIEKDKNIKFILVGGGPLLEECQKYLVDHNLQDKIILTGEVDSDFVHDILSISDIFVLVSDFEGLVMVVLEAMLHGLPVVASNVGGIKEIIEAGKGGFLIENQNINTFVEKIYFLIENTKEKKTFGENNRIIVNQKFSLNYMVDNYEKLYINDYDRKKI